MSSQDILWINIGVGALIALMFLVRNSQRAPSRLKMLTGSESKSPALNGDAKVASVSTDAKTRRRKSYDSVSNETVDAANQQARIKTLNVLFNYNGHTWDAFEVLGVPAGAPMSAVQAALEQSLKTTDPASHEFLRVAFQTIQKSR